MLGVEYLYWLRKTLPSQVYVLRSSRLVEIKIVKIASEVCLYPLLYLHPPVCGFVVLPLDRRCISYRLVRLGLAVQLRRSYNLVLAFK